MDNVYLKIFSIIDSYLAPIETIITLFIIKYCDSTININLVIDESKNNERGYKISLSSFKYRIYSDASEIPTLASFCELPNIVESGDNSCTAGLCATLRRLLKKRLSEDRNHHCQNLLGFKYSCLLACSETSAWTKFCEVEIISTLKFPGKKCPLSHELPATFARFERHMSQPVKLHNLYKYTKSKKFSNSDKVTRDESGHPDHSFAEGSSLTLSDIIIFVCVYVFVSAHLDERALELLPLTSKWYRRMMENDRIVESLEQVALEPERDMEVCEEYTLPSTENFSLYKCDPRRYKPRNRIYTRQDDIENSLRIIQESNLEIILSNEPFAMEQSLDWQEIPYEATPKGGSLPESRLQRKYQQLENLCKPVVKLAKPGDVIIDFCSGGGHLGILIAHLLPQCSVILLENKEESLKMAKERVRKLSLVNVKFLQCNLDYFKGDFNIGTSLHACGVATDLVIRQCIRRNAIFVCCPCCYGSIQDCHHITYPGSETFRDFVDKKSYLVLGHAADQTHDADNIKTKQGYECMAIIDTDRKLLAEQFGYKVHLGKLTPPSCTPKNNLLIGVPELRC